jgi:hypothetical protein
MSYRDYGYTEKTYIEFLLSLPLTSHLVPLKGATVEMDGKIEKTPIANFHWRREENWEKFAPYAEKHLRRGGWLAIAIKPNYTVIDIDEQEAKKKALEVYGNTFAVQTKRGVHLYYRGGHPALSGRKQCLVFKNVDYQNHNHYIIAPYADENRIWNRIENILDMPVEFYIQPSSEVRNLFEKDIALYHLKDGDGRNNVLYSIGRKIKLYAENNTDNPDEVVEEALHRISNLFADPLPSSEVDEVIKSVFSNEHREDFNPEVGNFFRGKDSSWDTEAEPDVNPFTVFKPLSAFKKTQRREVIKGLCREGDIVLLCGAPKGGKSTFLRSLAISATTQSTPPLPVTRTGKVWWYVLEEHPSDVFEVIRNTGIECNVEDILVSYADTNKLRDPLSAFIAGIRQMLATTNEPPVFIFVDTVGRVMNDFDINDYTKVQRTIEAIRWAIRDFENPPVVVLVHHTNKGGERGVSPLGSQAFAGSSDVVILLEATDEGVTMKATGRNVCPAFAMQTVPLRYERGIYVGIGSSVSIELAKLVQKIHRGEIATLDDALAYQGGVFRADIRRLLRKGILIYRSGNLYTNEYNKALEAYLTATDANEEVNEQNETLFRTEEQTLVTADAVVGVGASVTGYDAFGDGKADTEATADATAIATDTESDNGCDADYIGGCVGDQSTFAGDNSCDHSPEACAEGTELHRVEGLSEEGHEGFRNGCGYTTDTDAELEGNTASLISNLEANMETMKLPEQTKVTAEDVVAVEEAVSAQPPLEETAKKAGWQLVERMKLPPILEKVALNALTVGVKNALRPSDIDPFIGDELLDVKLKDVYDDIANEWYQTHPNMRNIDPKWFAERIAKHLWNIERLSLQEVISVHSAILRKYGKPHEYFPIRLPFISGWFLVCIIGKDIHLLPITDEEVNKPDLWRSLYWYYVRGEYVPIRKEYTAIERLLRRGLVFNLYQTPEGKRVYALTKKRFVINSEEDYTRYLCLSLGISIPQHFGGEKQE